MAHQVDCIEKIERLDPTEAIQTIGGRNPDGSRWKLSQKEAISGVKSGKWSFFVSSNGRNVNVIVAKSRYGNDYLRTESDDYAPNNLLSLKECSWVA